MKKALILAAALILIASGVAMATVAGTPHDLTGGTGEVCVACHTPHAAEASSSGPLWNRTQSAVASYTYYTSATFDMSVPALALGPQSLACMTCHNGLGSTIVNGPGSGAGDTAPYTLAVAVGNSIKNNAFSNIAEDLTNDHPVGFTVNYALDAGINNPIPATFPLYAGKIECATCHDVHNMSYDKTGTSQVYFLRASNIGSAMCLACHNK